MSNHEFFATCPEGFEHALADELRALGAWRIRPLKGRVTFEGRAADAERVCLWSRLASRVFAVLARFGAFDAHELYEGTYAVPWERILRHGATVAVTARGTTPELRNTHFTALKVKDALCDRLADEAGQRATVDTERPDARIAVAVRGERVTLSLDLSGEPLFRRMPRMATRSGAPAHFLRPDYAALALAQAGWAELCAKAGVNDGGTATETEGTFPVLIDACCAGGGIAAEAAAILTDQAPGLTRRHWGFFGWTEHDESAWNSLRDETAARAERGRWRLGRILATDVDSGVASFAKRVLTGTASGDRVVFIKPDAEAVLDRLRTPAAAGTTACGMIVLDTIDLPFAQIRQAIGLVNEVRGGEGAMEPVRDLARAMPVVALTRDGAALRALGEPERELVIMPGNEEARLLTFKKAGTAYETGFVRNQAVTATVDLGHGKPLPVLLAESEQFANRLKKNARLRRKWAKRAGVTCYRVYDADLPDYAAAIDLYEGSASSPGRWLVVAEYAAPRSVDAGLAYARMEDILAIAPVVLEVEPGCVYARSRTRSRGGSQYGKRGGAGMGGGAHLIEEGGLTFEVNFDSYLDTGIFLDHRVTRGLVRERVRERGARSFLNLFAYTGTATCYAADAGVAETTTVDLSNTYLDWAERNMAANGFTGRGHRFVRADVMRWIAEQRQGNARWDLVFCDPPTFSNSAKMGERTWDVQRDHVELLASVTDLLAPGGEAIFSCNLRTFKPDVAALEEAGVELRDITPQTIPEDFARNPRIHHCYLVHRA